ncbi:hypothetical protein LUCX_251 [Xanthomonas phage vB_XciM_LucasX]|nr:hypothetical protein LUCX_251 [Xanthomonas phage vB_XciM_LucasX]
MIERAFEIQIENWLNGPTFDAEVYERQTQSSTDKKRTPIAKISYTIQVGRPAKMQVIETDGARDTFLEQEDIDVPLLFLLRCIGAISKMYNIAPEQVSFGDPGSVLETAFTRPWRNWGPEQQARADAKWEFFGTNFMMADPNLVEYRPEWEGEHGAMTYAIFWLNEHWKSPMNAQGMISHPDGRIDLWNYSAATGMLYHRNRQGARAEITIDKMMIIKEGDRENATIYRPFYREKDGEMKMQWLATREVKIVSNHWEDEAPMNLRELLRRLRERLENHPFAEFPDLRLCGSKDLIDTSNITKNQTTTLEQAKIYQDLLIYFQRFKTHRPYRRAHFAEYMAFSKLIIQLMQLVLKIDAPSAVSKWRDFIVNVSAGYINRTRTPDLEAVKMLRNMSEVGSSWKKNKEESSDE